MKNPFFRQKNTNVASAEEQNERDGFEPLPMNATSAEIEQRRLDVEARKLERRLVREEKKFHKEQARRRQTVERWVAPLLFLVTIVISFAIYLQSR